MDLLEHSYNAYLRELVRRDELRRGIALPIGLSGALAGAWYSLARRFDWIGSTESFVVAFLMVLGLLTLISGAFFLVRSHVGYVYVYVPTAKEILAYSAELASYHGELSRTSSAVQNDTDEFLEREFANNAHENALNNNTKSKHLHNASVRLVASLGFLVAAGVIDLLVRMGVNI